MEKIFPIESTRAVFNCIENFAEVVSETGNVFLIAKNTAGMNSISYVQHALETLGISICHTEGTNFLEVTGGSNDVCWHETKTSEEMAASPDGTSPSWI